MPFALVAALVASAALVGAATEAPVIGILTVPDLSGDCITIAEQLRASSGREVGSCFDSLYSEWIGAAGGQVVPIRYDAPPAELERLFRSVNGVLFTGGETDIRETNSTYMRAAARLFNLAVAAHDSGEHVPLWGTCMGFQTLAILAAGRADALTSRGVPETNPGFDSDDISLPLDFIAKQGGTGWSNFAKGIVAVGGQAPLGWLATENITCNLHVRASPPLLRWQLGACMLTPTCCPQHDGVEPSAFSRIPRLGAFFSVVSTNTDLKGKAFVSTMEAKSGAPIYGVQWHPERNGFQFSLSAGEDHINHSLCASSPP
jgi:gamma-glutamyl hydrolase